MSFHFAMCYWSINEWMIFKTVLFLLWRVTTAHKIFNDSVFKPMKLRNTKSILAGRCLSYSKKKKQMKTKSAKAEESKFVNRDWKLIEMPKFIQLVNEMNECRKIITMLRKSASPPWNCELRLLLFSTCGIRVHTKALKIKENSLKKKSQKLAKQPPQ